MNNDNSIEGASEDLSPSERKAPKVKKVKLTQDSNLPKKEPESSGFTPDKAMVVLGKDRESMKRVLAGSEELQKNPGKYRVGDTFTVPRNDGTMDPDWKIVERIQLVVAMKDGAGRTAPIYEKSALEKNGHTVKEALGYKLVKGNFTKLFTDEGMEKLQRLQPKK